MIGQLRGKLLEKHPPHLLVEVNGVGYCVQVPLSTFFVLGEQGEEITLRIHHVVREDAQLLYGFITKEECVLFQSIIKVNGVGPKIGLAILSAMTVQEFKEVIVSQSVNRLQKVPGIGSKTAQRILVEMQDRLPAFDHTLLVNNHSALPRDGEQEAIEALMSLGYKLQEATKAVGKVNNKAQGCEIIIKEALQGLAKV